jgi:hypothetical protein
VIIVRLLNVMIKFENVPLAFHYIFLTILFNLGLSNSPTCERCQEGNETATHILCECEALAYLRLCHLGQYFMEPSEYFDIPTNKILRFKG